ncbi:MAG: hypothetical protein HGA35_05910, partial [Erysipelotrichaceae bacterium]|nr:hypothetical protein [Erysipelotrichaceae bacterium]
MDDFTMTVANFKEPCPLSKELKVACLIHHYNIVGEVVTMSLIRANFTGNVDEWVQTLVYWGIIVISYSEELNGRTYIVSHEAKKLIDDFY